jgi:tetratricopeptide (TPR) repeat protein
MKRPDEGLRTDQISALKLRRAECDLELRLLNLLEDARDVGRAAGLAAFEAGERLDPGRPPEPGGLLTELRRTLPLDSVLAPNAGAGETPLVGRTRQLRELYDAFEHAVRGRGGVQLVLGEPGIGKTRLVAALAERAAARGSRVIWTRGWGRAAPAYWPWIEVVRGLSQDVEGETLRRELGARADELLRLTPDLAERLPGARRPGPDDDDSEITRVALFDALAALLRVRSTIGPVVILVDDLQAVDVGSLVALEFVSRMLGDVAVLIVATVQERVPDRTSDAQLALQNIVRAGRRLVLGGLTRDDVARLIELTSGSPAPPGLTQAVHAVTEGNPFYAREIIALLLAESRLQDPPDELPLPESVRETIHRRLEPLDREALETLELAAIIGRTFDVTTLEHTASIDRSSVLAALDEASSLGLVIPVPGTLGQYRFGHGLIRDTLLVDMPEEALTNGHSLVGKALEQTYRGAIDAHLPELAHHFLSAGQRGDVVKAVDYAERAAHLALDTLAYEQAAELFSRALEALERVEPDVLRRASLLLGLGTAQSRAGRQAAQVTFEAAIGAARAIEADDIFARAVLGFAGFALTPGYVDEEYVAQLTEALDRIGAADDPTRVRLLCALAVALYWSDHAVRRAQLATDAIEMARRLGDEITLAIALSSAQLAISGPDTTQQGLAWLEELFSLTARTEETAMSLAARSRHIDLLLELDDFTGADSAIETLERLAHDSHDRRAAAYVPLHRARRAALAGRYDDAERLLAEVATIASELSTSVIPITVASQHIVLTWQQHGPRKIRELVRPYVAGAPGMPCWRAGLAAALADDDLRDEAKLEFDRLVADDFATLPRDNLWLTAMALLTETIVTLNLRDHAMDVYAKLAPFAGRNIVLPTVAYLGPVEMWLGILARIAGRHADALQQLAAARSRATHDGAHVALARIAVEEAAVLVGGDAAARTRAEGLLESAALSAEQIGLNRLAERVDTLRAQLPSTPPSETARPRYSPRDGTGSA